MLSLTLWTRLSHPPHSLQNPSFTASPYLLQYPTLPVYTTFLPSVSLSSSYQRSPFLFFFYLPLIVVPNILRAVGETHFNSLDENSFPRVEGSQTEKSSWTRLHFLRSMTDCLTSFFFSSLQTNHMLRSAQTRLSFCLRCRYWQRIGTFLWLESLIL